MAKGYWANDMNRRGVSDSALPRFEEWRKRRLEPDIGRFLKEEEDGKGLEEQEGERSGGGEGG